ncbi:hypothetical protein CBR_g41539 [Chara braunii]|uniref:ATP synthase F1 complex delta/epsilon subunit N-terminal domain-containing protein n=1 Tax=Chara braunii TaxID=69332 RepID=A0A388K2R4_CHABU|nr:hypothetical protein CBR_g41539 [Chara braunii]|eukprot:GBG64338.1 hypothetical protein CBR_g41539 [Chara braunii]
MLAQRSVRLLLKAGRGGALQSAFPSTKQAFATSSAALPLGEQLEEFRGKWEKAAPNLVFPTIPSQFMKPRPEVPAAIPDKLTFNFFMPHAREIDGEQVDMVILPATTGQMGVLPGHVPTVAQLRPGVLSVHEGKETKQYFVSSGFAFIHANSTTDVCAIEAVPLEDLNPEAVKSGLAFYTEQVNRASTELEKAEAEIGVEVHSAMSGALGL